MRYSFYTKAIYLLNLLPLCKNASHLRSFKSLLVVHGLIQHKGSLGQFLKSCFCLGAADIALPTFYAIKKPNLFLQNLVIKGLSNLGLHDHLLSVYFNCRLLGCPSDNFTFPFVIKACSNLGFFGILKVVHCVVLRTGYDQNVVIQTALVDFYAKNGYIESASKLVDKIPQPDLVAWNALLAGYSFHGRDQEAFEVFKHIFDVGLKPNSSTLASVFPICTRLGSFDIGRSVHGFAFKSGYLENDFLIPALISMYACDENLPAARILFNLVEKKNIAVWNAMVSALVQMRVPLEAFEIFQEMHYAGAKPNFVTFVSIIPSCEIAGSIWLGESLHVSVIKRGLENHSSVLTVLMAMYAKFGDISNMEFLFHLMPFLSLLSWNVMVSGYVHSGLWDASLSAFCDMQSDGFTPDAVSIINVLSACSKLQAILLGKSAHAFSIRKGISPNLKVSNALLSFYSDCNHLASSCKIFQKMDTRDCVSWNILISRFGQSGEIEKASELLRQLQGSSIFDLVTLISVLPMYCDRTHLGQGMALHGYAIKNGCASDTSLANALISMYFKCGDLESGRLLFEVMPKRCVVSWNALMGGYRHHNLPSEILAAFRWMINEKERPNSVTLLNLLPVCFNQLQGMSIHAYSIRAEILQETPLLTSLMFMYAKFANINQCLLLFEKSKKRDISLWNAIISVHIQAKFAERAVSFFCDMLRLGLQPDNITVLNFVSAYAQLSSLKLADSVMAYVVRKGFDKDVVISNALIDLYVRCGNISVAREIFESLNEKDAVSWTVMINGYGLHGDGEAAFELLSKMKSSGMKPSDATLISVLSACSHANLLKEGRMVFNSMVELGISPKIEQYACMVDLLGRTGYVEEAYDIVKKLPCKPSTSLLESLLGACKIHGHVELGEKVSGMLFEMDPENSGPYVMLSSIYSAAGRWTDADRVRSIIEARQLRKAPGFSFLNV